MTRTQALKFVLQSSNEHKQEAEGYTEAMTISEGRLIVRDIAGKAVAITNRYDYAASVRMQFMGTIHDRADWRTNPAPLF